MNTIYLTEGDTLPVLQGQLVGDSGEAVDITGYTIALHLNYPEPFVKAAEITDATAGKFVVRWDAGDLRPGRWYGEIEYTSVDGVFTCNRVARKGWTPGKRMIFHIARQIA